ncbi:MAG: hypothetical protein E4G91_08975, partial [Candidatus Zixiibacteriota bacterium]
MPRELRGDIGPGPVRLSRPKCGRADQYRRFFLIARFDPKTSLPDLAATRFIQVGILPSPSVLLAALGALDPVLVESDRFECVPIVILMCVDRLAGL